MKQWILKTEILDKIKSDAMLYGKVATVLEISITSMPRLLQSNSKKLTQISALETISKHLQLRQRDLIELVELETAA